MFNSSNCIQMGAIVTDNRPFDESEMLHNFLEDFVWSKTLTSGIIEVKFYGPQPAIDYINGFDGNKLATDALIDFAKNSEQIEGTQISILWWDTYYNDLIAQFFGGEDHQCDFKVYLANENKGMYAIRWTACRILSVVDGDKNKYDVTYKKHIDDADTSIFWDSFVNPILYEHTLRKYRAAKNIWAAYYDG